MLVGLAFKASLFPFHAWAPEVYQGAKTFIVAYLIVIVKSIVVLFFLRSRILFIYIDDIPFTAVLSVMAIFSMWIGNGLMLKENNIFRLLAFLSIGHFGTLIIPLLSIVGQDRKQFFST